MIDLVAMAAKELGFQVQDDETNIQNLTKTMGIDKELGNKLKKQMECVILLFIVIMVLKINAFCNQFLK